MRASEESENTERKKKRISTEVEAVGVEGRIRVKSVQRKSHESVVTFFEVEVGGEEKKGNCFSRFYSVWIVYLVAVAAAVKRIRRVLAQRRNHPHHRDHHPSTQCPSMQVSG